MRKMEQLPVIWSDTHCYCGRILPGASEEVQKQILKNVIRRGLLGSSGTLFPGWFGGLLLSPGEALTRLLGLLLLDLTLLLIGAETAGGVMTKLIVRNITVLGALNSDVHAKLPFLLESSLADVLCCLALAFCVRPVFSTFA